MSKILELVKKAEQIEKQQEQALETEIHQKVEQLGNDLTKRLEEKFKKIENVLDDQSEQICKSLLKLYKKPLYCLVGVCLGLCLVSFIASFYFISQAKQAYQERNAAKASADLYQKMSKGFIVKQCQLADGTYKTCIQLDPNYRDQTWDKNFKIIKTK